MIFVYPNLNEATPESDPVVAHEVNMDICRAFLRRHLLEGMSLFKVPVISRCCYNYDSV